MNENLLDSLDSLDKQIIEHLSRDARVSNRRQPPDHTARSLTPAP